MSYRSYLLMAWSASTQKAQRRDLSGTPAVIKVQDEAEYAQIRYHVHSLIWAGYPVWYIPRESQAERAWFGYAPPGTYGAAYPGDRDARTLVLTLVELDPKGR